MSHHQVDLSTRSEEDLMRLEKHIAKRHLDHFPWLIVTWSLLNFAIWLSLWPLVMMGLMPLWLGFLIATLNISLSYLPCHDAQHSIIAKPGDKLRWLNELIGWVGSIPLIAPYSVLRATHLEHHKHANDPEFDPDFYVKAAGPWHALWKIFLSRQPRGDTQQKRYLATLERINREDLIPISIFFTLGFYIFLFAMSWSGYVLVAALLWWLPAHIAATYLSFFLSWAPHHPSKETGRYKDTRAWRFQLGNIASMGMQYHIVHHLHPRIPLYRTPKAYWELRPILKARGCNLNDL